MKDRGNKGGEEREGKGDMIESRVAKTEMGMEIVRGTGE